MKRILSVALALLLVFGILPVANAAALFDSNGQEQVLGSDGGDTVTPSNRDRKNGKLFEAAPEAEEPEATEIVPIIIEMEDEPALAVTKSVEAAAPVEAKLLEKQQVMQKDIERALGVNLDVKYNHTLVYNGFSFYGEYGLVERINNLNCGAYAYVAPQFESPKMTQSIGIIGGDVAWAEGYSGEGTTVAILDTGIRLNHEAFSVVPQSIELTQDELQARIDAAGSSFNAGTNLSQLYKSGKIPFAYNYYRQNYNPAHDYSPHGSHVAGIAAGNNGSNFKGVAPDAQLIVMHVFMPSGGASWTEILPALEDCAYLGVDSANMSLGSTCGFTNYNGYGYEESFALLRQAGVNLSVAAGNDDDATAGNRWGSGRQIAYNPDYGVVGSPSTWPESLSVASSTKGSGTPVSGFSSRGTTSDLKIKPEILAPGSSIYSVNGNGSGYMNNSGTSMAAPHVAGGMAIVKQYVEQMFPNANEETKMELVDAILMSTAVPGTYSNGNPYFVREQGAGLMNLAGSVHTTAYLSVEDCVRPKLEIGSSANGVFELNFTVNNFGDTELTYNLSATVLTETPYSGSFSGQTKYYINGTPYVLNDLVNIDAPQTVTVPAGGTTDVSMTITLNDEAKAFFEEHFEAGMFVEGFVKLQGVEANGETPVNLGIPFLGFYGDWNYPAMIEVNANYYQDNPTYSQRYANIVGYKSGNTIQGLGINPYVDMTEAQFLADRGAVSPNNDGYYESINVLYANLMRNAVNIEYGVEFENGEYAVLTSADCIKKGNRPDGEWLMQQMGVDYMTFPTWKLGALADGESAVLKVIATLDNEGYTPEANANGIWDIPVTKDLTAPEIVDVEVISGGVRITFTDAHYVAYAEASAGSQTIAENGYFENERGVVSTMDVITSASEFTFFLGDYAANEAEYTINTATGDFDGGAVNPPGPPVEHDIDEALNVQGGELAFENHMLLPWITEEVGGRLYAKSDIAGVDNCTTSFSTTVNMVAGDELSFDWKVSSEADYDYLFFYANGEEVEKISGNRNWATYTWTAPSDGEYTFEWSYVKDPYTGEGSDCGYVDNVAVNSDTPPVTPTVPPVTPTPTPVIPGDGFVETNEIIPGEEYIIAVDYNGQIMMMSNVLDSDNSIRLVGDPAQMSGDAIVGGYSNNHLWTFSSETASTIQSVGNGRYCEVVTHNGYAWL
nr:S8 family serine peptidase [Christensenellales bacterium]